MTDTTRESIENLTQIVRELTARLEIQEAELQRLRSSRPSRSDRPGRTEGMSGGGGISRSHLLRIAGVGAVAVAAAGVEMGGRANTAFAKSGDAVTAGAVTNSESATMVNYDGVRRIRKRCCFGQRFDLHNSRNPCLSRRRCGSGGSGQHCRARRT